MLLLPKAGRPICAGFGCGAHPPFARRANDRGQTVPSPMCREHGEGSVRAMSPGVAATSPARPRRVTEGHRVTGWTRDIWEESSDRINGDEPGASAYHQGNGCSMT